MPKLTPYIIAISTLFLSSCANRNQQTLEPKNQKEGVIKDYSNLDGCKWLIELKDGTKLQPISFPTDFVPYPDLPIQFTYEEVDAMSICMAGKTVEIKTINPQQKPRVFPLVSDVNPKDFAPQINNFQLLKHHMVPGRLYLTLQYSGCKPFAELSCVASPMETRSLPPQRAVALNWENTDCEMLITETIIIDLSELKYTTTLLFQTTSGTERITVEP